MANLWVISDTHFFHENILKFDGGRQEFATVKEMNSFMIERWNSVVKKGDKVYHLGDVAMGPQYQQQIGGVLNYLNGQKRLIVGNHDEIPFLAKGSWFGKVELWRTFKDFGMILSHIPLHDSAFADKWEGRCINVHGHIHRHKAPSKKHYCVCVEQTGYTPINMEELRDAIW